MPASSNTDGGSNVPREESRVGSLLSLLQRIETAIEAETAAIRSNGSYDLAAFNARKSRHLYELGQAFKGIRKSDLGPEHRAAIVRLRERLAENEATISANMSAVGEIATLLQSAIEQAQTDGTYSTHEFAQG